MVINMFEFEIRQNLFMVYQQQYQQQYFVFTMVAIQMYIFEMDELMQMNLNFNAFNNAIINNIDHFMILGILFSYICPTIGNGTIFMKKMVHQHRHIDNLVKHKQKVNIDIALHQQLLQLYLTVQIVVTNRTIEATTITTIVISFVQLVNVA